MVPANSSDIYLVNINTFCIVRKEILSILVKRTVETTLTGLANNTHYNLAVSAVTKSVQSPGRQTGRTTLHYCGVLHR